MPPLHDPVRNIGVASGKLLGDIGRVAFEQKQRGVRGIIERAGQKKLSALVCLPSHFQVRIAEFRAPGDVILANFVKQ
jgi:hypothetical protein